MKIIEDYLASVKMDSHSPLILTVYMTSECNLQCAYCYERDKPMTEAIKPARIIQFINILDKFAIPLEAVFLFGGEPTLYPAECLLVLQELDRFERYKETRKVLFTNGIILPEILLEHILSGQLEVFLSSDGFDKASILRYGKAYPELETSFLHNLKRMMPAASRITISAAVGNHNIYTIVQDINVFFEKYHINSFKINIIRKKCFAAPRERLEEEREKAMIWAEQHMIRLFWDAVDVYGSQYDNIYVSQKNIVFQPSGQLGTWDNVAW